MNPPQGNCISSSSLKGRKLIGEGAFGTVYKVQITTHYAIISNYSQYQSDPQRQKTTWTTEGTVVAIKIMKNATISQVFSERNRMASLDHDNVVKLLGFVQQKGCVPWLVMEYMPHGDLLSYILKHRSSSGGLTARVMMKIAWGIARGMEYLHDQEIVHGDLAARNCLIGHGRAVKIGDLGFHDASNADDYHNYTANNPPCPIRWMPPENFPYALSCNGQMISAKPKHTEKGDIWAYGVVLFELWSRGEKPFSGYTNFEVCEKVLRKWKPTRIHKVTMKHHVRNLMHNCWQFNPKNRPSFSSAVQHFEEHEGFQSDDEESETDTESESGESYYDSQSDDDYSYGQQNSDDEYYYY